LDVGLGKTESAVALVASAHQLGLPHSVLIASSKVADLAQMYGRLMANDVPPNRVAVWHSKRAKEALGVQCSSKKARNERPYLLVCHERLRLGRQDLAYRSQPHDLTIWDESLVTSSHRVLSLLDLDRWTRWLVPCVRGTFYGKAAIEWCMEVVELLNKARENGATSEPIRLPNLQPDLRDNLIGAVENAAGKRRLKDIQPILGLLENGSDNPVRLRMTGEESTTVVTIEVSVPDDLNPIAILDASHPIRELVDRSHGSIVEDPWFVERKRKERESKERGDGLVSPIKSYRRVVGRIWKHAAGKDVFTNPLRKKTRQTLLAEVAKDVGSAVVPENEPVLFFVPKQAPGTPNVERELREAMDQADVPTRLQKVEGKRAGPPRFHVLHWGLETSTNAFSGVKYLYCVSAPYRDRDEISVAIAARDRDLMADPDAEEVLRVVRSEVAYKLHQAIGRTACRVVENGVAMPVTFSLILPPEDALAIRELLDEVMPELTWEPWNEHIKSGRVKGAAGTPRQPRAAPKRSKAAAAIATHLTGQPSEVVRMPNRSVKSVARAACGGKLDGETWRAARDAALARCPGWRLDGQAFVRA